MPDRFLPRVTNISHLNCVIWSPAGCASLTRTPPQPSQSSPLKYRSTPQVHFGRVVHEIIASKMARSKKSDDKPDESASLQISLEDFIRTRDSVSNKLHSPSRKLRVFKNTFSQRNNETHPSISHNLLTYIKSIRNRVEPWTRSGARSILNKMHPAHVFAFSGRNLLN